MRVMVSRSSFSCGTCTERTVALCCAAHRQRFTHGCTLVLKRSLSYGGCAVFGAVHNSRPPKYPVPFLSCHLSPEDSRQQVAKELQGETAAGLLLLTRSSRGAGRRPDKQGVVMASLAGRVFRFDAVGSAVCLG